MSENQCTKGSGDTTSIHSAVQCLSFPTNWAVSCWFRGPILGLYTGRQSYAKPTQKCFVCNCLSGWLGYDFFFRQQVWNQTLLATLANQIRRQTCGRRFLEFKFAYAGLLTQELSSKDTHSVCAALQPRQFSGIGLMHSCSSSLSS